MEDEEDEEDDGLGGAEGRGRRPASNASTASRWVRPVGPVGRDSGHAAVTATGGTSLHWVLVTGPPVGEHGREEEEVRDKLQQAYPQGPLLGGRAERWTAFSDYSGSPPGSGLRNVPTLPLPQLINPEGAALPDPRYSNRYLLSSELKQGLLVLDSFTQHNVSLPRSKDTRGLARQRVSFKRGSDTLCPGPSCPRAQSAGRCGVPFGHTLL
ncbi:unnamed protein product [Boreogadus saida]